MSVSALKYWKFQGRALLTRMGMWDGIERWRLRRRFHQGFAHETDFLFFRHFDGSNRLFVDIGANLGQSALSFRLANRTCPILSFEPNPDMAHALCEVKRILGQLFDFRMHGLGARTEIKRLFVPVVNGIPFTQLATLRRECLENNTSASQIIREWAHTGRFIIAERPIQLVQFDELGLNPAFVKMDVEGGEVDVVTGMEETLARFRPLLMTEGAGARDFLAQRGYKTFLHQPAGNYLAPARAGEVATNFFFVPEENVPKLERMGAIKNPSETTI
jgi:FkbM family methyltransferase